ncbi:hypothetical protein E2320_016105 [Naja naja]|nr:hypothetical protein E2320_016105 [Naja naja]
MRERKSPDAVWKDAELSEEKELVPSSQWQDISNMDQCKKSLGHWLEMQKGFIDWDRLARALRQIGRPDVSRELKKSIIKNRSLEPKWNTEENQTGAASKSLLIVRRVWTFDPTSSPILTLNYQTMEQPYPLQDRIDR